MKKAICLLLTSVVTACFAASAHAQVTPPGQGGKLVLWTALEVEQQMGKRWTSHTTFGIGRHSGPNNYAILEQPGVFTVREGFSYKLTKQLTASLTGMYAQRPYFEENLPAYQQELRLYPKLKHTFSLGNITFSEYIRLDFRRFYQPGWSAWKNPLEIRPRYQLKASMPFTRNKRTSLILITEMMGATRGVRKEVGGQVLNKMQPFQYTENRTSLYLRHQLKHLNWYVDMGVMHQYWRQKENQFKSTFLFGVDVIMVSW